MKTRCRNPKVVEQPLEDLIDDIVLPENDEQEHEEENNVDPHPPRPPRPSRSSVIERFARSHGFSLNGTGKFHHPDGRTLEKTVGNSFPWQLKSAAGETLQYFWDREHCIERTPLQLEAEVWELCQQFPKLYSLILSNTENAPIKIECSQLLEMTEQDTLVLYPATYRLEYRG